MRIGPKKRHVTDSLTLAKQVLDSNVECDKLEDIALICWERRDHLKLHLDSYKKLRIELEDAALQEGGLVLKWPEFYDEFQAAVDSNPNLSGVDKFNYLHSRLEGDALEVISGMTLTYANYDKAKDILKERYGRQDVIVNAHYKSLVSLPMSSSTTSALCHAYDVIEKHRRSLEAIN